MSEVCANCIDDPNIAAMITGNAGDDECDYCDESDAPTMSLSEVADFIRDRLAEFYGHAVDQLPHDSEEGGYFGAQYTSHELLFEEVGLDLPRDKGGRLQTDLADAIGDDLWCDYDFARFDYDDELLIDWKQFCNITKFQRRFFFHNVGAAESLIDEASSPLEFLKDIGQLIDELGLFRTRESGYRIFRGRDGKNNERYESPTELGPPPPERAVQSNRMNPPGIPIFYGSDNPRLADVETGGKGIVSIGEFVSERELRLLDLANLPEGPGFFSDASRRDVLGAIFLRQFAELIVVPVERDDRTHIDYIPTQIFTEFLRDFAFEGGPIDGLLYRSATDIAGVNIALFATQKDIIGSPVFNQQDQANKRLGLVNVVHYEPAERGQHSLDYHPQVMPGEITAGLPLFGASIEGRSTTSGSE
jgi:hypothetical protein